MVLLLIVWIFPLLLKNTMADELTEDIGEYNEALLYSPFFCLSPFQTVTAVCYYTNKFHQMVHKHFKQHTHTQKVALIQGK